MPSKTRTQYRKDMGVCTACGSNPPVVGGTKCASCRELRRRRYQENKAAVDLQHRHYVREHLQEVSTYQRTYGKEYRNNTRGRAIELLGNQCANCGFLDTRVLQIDHVYGGGRQHVKKFGGRTTRYYQAVIRDIEAGSQDYQLLCPNCHAYKTLDITP